MDLVNKFEDLMQQLAKKQQYDREFEEAITQFTREWELAEREKLRTFLQHKLDGDNFNEAYVAFLILATFYRRNEEIDELRNLFNSPNEKRFEKEILYPHFKAMMHKSSGENKRAYELLRKLVKEETLQKHSGVIHSYAEVIITLAEENSYLVGQEEINEGYKQVNLAINFQGDYAKFHATKARYHILANKPDDAREDIKAAKKYEKIGPDYYLRLAQYYQLESEIRFKQDVSELKRDYEEYRKNLGELVEEYRENIGELVQEQRDSLEETKRQSLQMLGFFTAIISFTIGSLQIAMEQTFPVAASLILILAGVLLIVYSGFSMTIFYSANANNFWINLIMFGMGIVIVVLSVLAYHNGWFGENI